MKFSLLLVLVFIQSYLWSADDGYKQLLKERLAHQAQDVFYLYDIASTSDKRTQFMQYERKDLDEFLTNFFGDYYDGHNELIDEYMVFFTNQPLQHLRVWFGLFDEIEGQLHAKQSYDESVIKSLLLSQIYLLPAAQVRESNNHFLLSAPIAQRYGLQITDYVDERLIFDKNSSALGAYFSDLSSKFSTRSFQIAALVLGANTVKKAQINEPYVSSYWDLYPSIKSPHRDFYPAMLAASFLWSKRKESGLVGYNFSSKREQTLVEVTDTVHVDQIAAVLSIEKQVLSFMNAQYYKGIIPSGHTIVLPNDLKESFVLLKDSISNFNKSLYFSNIMDSCYVFYRTNRGDYFRDLTRWFGPSLEEIKKLNGFSSNTLPNGWDVFFKVPCADSAEFAAFDNLSRSQKDAVAKGQQIPVEQSTTERFEKTPDPQKTSAPTGIKITYVVKSGDSLWAIGQKHKVSDTDIMKWNNIGTNIKPGQKLIIYLP
jgi:LysM repeat protein